MSYRVTSPLVLARDKEGKVHERYEGAVIDWLNDDQKRHFLEAELVVKIGSAAAEPEPVVEANDGDKPSADAVKQELIDWLVANAVDEDGNDYTESALKPKNKDQLWELIDAVE
jgi:hypothetical protein